MILPQFFCKIIKLHEVACKVPLSSTNTCFYTVFLNKQVSVEFNCDLIACFTGHSFRSQRGSDPAHING